ncbi:hypothetical protein [Blastococcus sp. DSM 46786]|uniref:hypothetical protein n=1 Tax=Blastococcus sp. DSM 46786 TaxID=1798227 RepID=UPI001113D055|nr:hypothetical protein [Blastococcus sp. DSM 46786]
MQTTTVEDSSTERAEGTGASSSGVGSERRGTARRSWPQIAGLISLVLLVLVVPIVHARQAMHVVPTYHLDGAFQTASGLFRLAEGQWPGRDFFPYLGIGPVVVLFPAFAAFGGTLAASVFASYFVTLLSLQLVVGLVAALVFPRRPVWAMAWAATVPAVLVAVAMTRPELWSAASGLLANAAVPGNSLRPIRAVAPYLVAAVAFFVLRSAWSWRRTAVVGAVAGAIAALWSNDYGLVSGVLVLVLLTLYAIRWRPASLKRILPPLWLAASVSYLVAGFAATAGHFASLARYNFVDVREDQFWYFSPWGRADRIYSVGDVLHAMQLEGALWPLAVLAGIGVYALLSRSLAPLLLLFTGGSILAGGLAATIGGHTGGYFWSFVLWGSVVSAAVVVRLVVVGAARLRPVQQLLDVRRLRVGARALVSASAIAVLLSACVVAVQANWSTGSAVAGDPRYAYDAELGGYLDQDYANQVEQVRGHDGIVEEYMGLGGVINGPNKALPVDSVIAALGSQRDLFQDRMADRPALVVTTAPSASNWVTWGLSANWWFYRELFQSYAPTQSSPLTLNWVPVEPAVWQPVPCQVRESQIELAAPSAGLYEVTLQYQGPGRGSRSFTMVQNDVNVASGARGFMALDPGAAEQRFPVALPEPGPVVLSTSDVAPHLEQLTTLESCTASAVRPPQGADTFQVFSSLFLTPVDLTDATWERGVAREGAALFVFNTPLKLAALQDATEVRFPNGETRVISRVEEAGDFINVFLDGPPLDPRTAGAGQILTPVP